jgi:hypothetical protein
MAAAAVQNFNSPIYVVPPFNAGGGPSLATQSNNNMRQQTGMNYYNRALNNNRDPAPDSIAGSIRANGLSGLVTIHGDAGRFADIESFNRRNQDPRTMMDYAEAPYGNARNQVSLITNPDHAPEPLLKVNNKVAQLRQQTRERMCRF